MGWIRCVHCENVRRNFVGRTFALIAPIQTILHWVYFVALSLGSTRWIGCVCCEKIRRDFVARTFALIAPVQPILHRVSCSNEIVPNAPKHYETHQNMSLGPDGVDRVDLLQKILTQLCGLNFWINFNSSARFEPSIVKQRNGPKCSQTLRNKTKHKFSVQWGGSGAFIAKTSDTTSWRELLH